ncbi:Gypsy retrotransposon integrase-like protein 1 [Recurvomyces mirabilis]|nr:Gypsy retrotransposon integrase-like protein 1 [Recurvomyces mirabilis]
MILYANGASMLSTCHFYICTAVAADLQMGLFNELLGREMPEQESSTRRIISTVLSITDTFVTPALGIPRTFRDIEPPRSLPTAIVDIYHPLYGTYMHAQLTHILAMTVEFNHPFTRPIDSRNGFAGIEYSKIVASEVQFAIVNVYVEDYAKKRLEQWFDQLQFSQPADNAAPNDKIMRFQLTLRLYYAHVQMVLYGPFLHHSLGNERQASHTNIKAYACGSACVKAAIQVVWLVERLEASSLFNARLWHVAFIITFAAACLSLYVTSNRGAPTVHDTEDAVRRIKELCSRHAKPITHCGGASNTLRFGLPPHASRFLDDLDLDIWNSFTKNTLSFTEAFHAIEEPDPEHSQDDNVWQALSLPHLQPFLNDRL